MRVIVVRLPARREVPAEVQFEVARNFVTDAADPGAARLRTGPGQGWEGEVVARLKLGDISIEIVGAEHDLKCARAADQAREPLQCCAALDQSDADLGIAEQGALPAGGSRTSQYAPVQSRVPRRDRFVAGQSN